MVYLKGFAACRRPLDLDAMIRCFDDCWSCLLALVALLATWHGFWAPFLLLGMALDVILEALGISLAWAGSRTGPGTPEWAGLHSRLGGSTVLLGSRDPGDSPSGGRFDFSGPYYQFNNCLIQGTFISELLDSRLRKVTV